MIPVSRHAQGSIKKEIFKTIALGRAFLPISISQIIWKRQD